MDRQLVLGLDGEEDVLEEGNAAVVAKGVDGVLLLGEDEGQTGSVDHQNDAAQIKNHLVTDAAL
jgi:hypothetical protein